jgi:hypothetical protein
MLMVCDLLVYVGEIVSESRKSFNKIVEDDTPATVKVERIDNGALVSDQGYHISLLG